MTTVVRALEDPGEVLAQAAAFLSSDPVRHNLVLTILHDRVGNPAPGRYWIVEQLRSADGPRELEASRRRLRRDESGDWRRLRPRP
jgi:hypothetical protein